MRFERRYFDYFERLRRLLNSQPLLLAGVAGSGGGSGGPPGGFIGQLPQSKVTFDLSELAVSGIPSSGPSLVDNLNRIRYRIAALEGAAGGADIEIRDEGIQISPNITVMDFVGNGIIASANGSIITVTVSGINPNGSFFSENLSSQVPLPSGGSYTTAYDIPSGSLRIFYNGVRQLPAHYSYTPGTNSIILNFATYTGDELLVDYGSEFGAGVDSFTDLSDTPATYAGSAGKFVKVNGGATGLEFVTQSITNLDSLSDVVITGITDNEVLAYDQGSGNWINQTPSEAGLSAVGHTHTESQITDLAHTTQFLQLSDTPSSFGGFAGYLVSVNQAENSLTFVPSGGGILFLDDLIDVELPTLFDKDILAWDNLSLRWTSMNKATLGIPTTFLGLTDTPASYSGQGSKFVKVNAGATALEFISASSITVRKNSGSNVGTRPRLNFIEGSNVTLTIADDSGGDEIDITIASTGGSGTVVRQVVFTVEGTLSANPGPLRIPNKTGSSLTISRVRLDVNTAPSGSAIIVDVNKNGTTIFTTQSNRPQIADGAFTGETTTINVPTWADGDYLQIDVDQIGSSSPGANLTITIVCS